MVIANRRHTDLFEWGQRTTPFSLAAEIQRRLLPTSYTCEAGQFTLAGWLEPASTVGGDTFDYNLDRETLHMSITDAVGHEVEAALLATLLVGSLRNGRRRGLNLLDQADNANDALAAHTRPGEFVTGQLLRVDLRLGQATIINAGHPLPLRLRNGRVEEVPLDIDLPFGLQPNTSFRMQAFSLAPGDRFVFVTDGMLERNAAQLDVAATLGADQRPASPRSRPRARRRRPARHRRRPPRRRHRRGPRLVRGTTAPPREHARSQPASRLRVAAPPEPVPWQAPVGRGSGGATRRCALTQLRCEYFREQALIQSSTTMSVTYYS